MRVSVLVGAAIVGFGGLMYAGASSYLDDQEPDLKVVEEALELLGKGDTGGFDVLSKRFPSNNDPKNLDSQARLIRIQTDSLGEPCGIELVGAEGVGTSIRGYTYLYKYELGCMRFRLNFYRPKDEWKLTGIWFDTGNDNALFMSAGYKLPLVDHSDVAGRPQPAHR